MKRLLLILAIATTASAQTNSVTFSILQPRFSSASARIDGDSMPISFRSRSGFRLGFARSLGRAAFDVDVARMSTPASIATPGGSFGVGTLTLTPISATVSVHGGNDRFTPYIGAGAAYVMTGDLQSSDLAAQGLGRVTVDNDLTYLLNAGLGIAVTPAVSVNLDARYMPVNVAARFDDGRAQVKFNALTFGAGLRWRF